MEARSEVGRQPRGRARSWTIALLAGAVVAVAAFFVVRALNDDGGNGGKLQGASGNQFTLSYPEGWTPVPRDEAAVLKGSPTAVLRRDDRRGIVIINRQRRVTRDLDALSRQLDRRLKRRFSDFRKVSSKKVQVKAGPAFLYTYVRRRNGTAHSLLAVQTSSGAYTLNAVVRADAPDVARQVGAMLRSFDA
jgi:hypothetical protein